MSAPVRTAPTRRRRLAAYAWAAPTTAVGLLAGGLAVATGGSARVRDGVLEVRGGLGRSLLRRRPLRASAITLGHVIVGRDESCLDSCRDHEHGHVAQVELLGPFFLPAYLLAATWARLRHGEHYHANWFERDAERHAATVREARRE